MTDINEFLSHLKLPFIRKNYESMAKTSTGSCR